MRRLLRARRLRRGAARSALALAAVSTGLVADAWVAFGHQPEGARLAHMAASPQHADGIFVNPQPMWMDWLGSVTAPFRSSGHATPDAPVPTLPGDRTRFAAPPATGLRVTWLGHSTQLIEIDGVTVLTDPIFGGRSSPFTWLGPAAWYDPPIPLAELPPIDAVLLSHDHYDHLQRETIEAMAGWDTTFVVPLGVGAHLVYWGVPEGRVVELDWWDRVEVGDLEIVATPARHASGRHLLDQNRTLWASYALIGDAHRVWFSGDTGLFPALDDIGARLGPFDLTLIESGAYDAAWPDWHLGPEQAVRAHQMVRGDVLIPVHWGLWALAGHGWTEPVERVLVEAARRGVTTFVPRPGQSFEPEALPPLDRWWPDVPWSPADETPIVSTLVDPG